MREKIQVWKDGGKVLIRSKYSETFDLVVELRHMTDENAWLLSQDMQITDYDKGKLIHLGPDDFPASFFGEYDTLSGNHGSCFARMLTIFDHNMDDRNLGAIFTDEKGNEFCLMQIVDKDNLLIHPVASGPSVKPRFASYKSSKLFYNGRLLPVICVANAQLYPSNRFRTFQFLIDGKSPLIDRVLTECTYLDHVMEFDVVSPLALVNMVKNNPGKQLFPKFSKMRKMVMPEDMKNSDSEIYQQLQALVSYKVTMRHEASGACVIYRNAVTKQEITWLKALDIMWIWSGEFSEMPVQEFYIPNIRPFTLTTKDGQQSEMDFANVVQFDQNFPAECKLTQENCINPAIQPRRFIRFSGDKNSRKLGFALGYSHCYGLTSEPKWNTIRPDIYLFYGTWKMYPCVYHIDNPPLNWSVDTVAYRQYFNPADSDFTSIYYHHEYDDLIIWIDCHKALKNKIVQLPEEAANCDMEIVEKTDSFIIAENTKPMNNQLIFSINGSSGYAIIRLKPQKS